jgi:hypothetical protein
MEKGPPLEDRIDIMDAVDLITSAGFINVVGSIYNDCFYIISAIRE